jgi:PAS domain-containing protein
MKESVAHDRVDESAQRLRAAFDSVWTLTTLLTATLLVVCWYFGLARLNIERAVLLLSVLTGLQLALTTGSRGCDMVTLRHVVLTSQLLGTAFVGVVWHQAGGLQQPILPLLIVLPLLPAFALLNLWQRTCAGGALVMLMLTGVLLAPSNANSFLQERYGLQLALHGLPTWLPRSRVAFADVSVSAPYELMLTATAVVTTIALAATAGIVASISVRLNRRTLTLGNEVERLRQLNTQLMVHAPSADLLVAAGTGRIVTASLRFAQEFNWTASPGSFLLDVVSFRFPDLIRRLMLDGGEDVQIATIQGREYLLRVRAVVAGQPGDQLSRMCFERCDELAWRGEVNALDEPIFAINSNGQVLFPNRAAVELLGAAVEGRMAESLFEGSAEHWWDISPLVTARRVVRHGGARYVASIRRERLASSVTEMSIVRLSVNRELQAA